MTLLRCKDCGRTFHAYGAMHYKIELCRDCEIKGVGNVKAAKEKKKQQCGTCKKTEADLLLLLFEMCDAARTWKKVRFHGAHILIVSYIKTITSIIRQLRKG